MNHLTPLNTTFSVRFNHDTGLWEAEPAAAVNGSALYCEGHSPVEAASHLKEALSDRGYFIPNFGHRGQPRQAA